MTLASILALVCVGAAISPTLSATVKPVVATGCDFHGTTYPDGQSFQPNPCTHCFCQGGRPVCAVADCMMPSCVDSVSQPDRCCPVCPNGPNCRAPDGTTIQAGQHVQINPTTTCQCDHAHFSFMMTGDAVCVTKEPAHVINHIVN